MQMISQLRKKAVPEERYLKYGDEEEVPKLHQFRDSVRLRPIIEPLQGHRSWIGGCPSLPPDREVPKVNGKSPVFLAQICCSDLPQNTWGGVGPRDGWLVFFVTAKLPFEAIVLHTRTLGEKRNLDAGVSRYWKWNCRGETHGEPVWPIELIHHEFGDEEMISTKSLGYDPRFPKPECYDDIDFQTGALRPFDWATAHYLLSEIVGKAKSELRSVDETEADLTKRQAAIETLDSDDECGVDRAGLAKIRYQRSFSSKLRGLRRAKMREAEQLFNEAIELSSTTEFSRDLWLSFSQRIDTFEKVWLEITEDTAEGGAQGFSHIVRSQSLIADVRRWKWQDYAWFHYYRAQQLFQESGASLLPEVRKHYEEIWNFEANYCFAKMGGIPDGYISTSDFEPLNFASREDQFLFEWWRPEDEPFDGENAVLLEVSSSHLTNWIWGDCYNAVFRIPKKNLVAGDFSVVEVNVSN